MTNSATTLPTTSSTAAVQIAEPPRRWAILALLALAQLLGMSLWFTASATATQLAALWSLEAAQAARLTTAVQIGFVAGTALAAVLNLADVWPARRYVAICASLAALANASLLLASGPATALLSRFLTGFFLAGVYPPAMKMAATWFRTSRGFAIGVIVGALTVGKALPYLIGALGTVDYRFVVLSTSAGALLAASLVALAYQDGPFPFARRPFSWSLVGVIVRHRETRLAIGGYLGHMWELYACWSLVALFFFDFFTTRGATQLSAGVSSGVVAFSVIAMGGIGSVLAGVWADRFGRERITIWAMAISGMCSLVIGWLGDAPAQLVIAIGLVWGLAIVADSAQFSAVVTEVAPAHAVGTALTLQTSTGFLLTAFSIWATAGISARFGWGLAFSLLVLGPVFGIASMVRLRAVRAAASPT